MKNNFDDDLAKRLSKADPAKSKKAPKLSESILTKAASADKPLSLGDRLMAMGRSSRNWLVSGSAVTAAAAVAIAVVISSTPAPLIQMGASSGMRNGESSAVSQDAALKQWMPYQIFEYSAGPSLSNERGSGTVYKLNRTGDPEDVLRKVAAVMGVTGSIKKVPEFSKDNPGYFLSESKDPWGYDSENPTVSLWWSSTGYWSYSNPKAYPQVVCEKEGEDGYCTEYKSTPELLPSRAEAIAKALEVFGATGLTATESDLRIYMDEWGISISSPFKVDGQETGIEWYIGWSSNGEVSYAGGHSVVAENMGEFETISAVSAVGRLDDWRWFGSPASSYYEKYAPVVQEGVTRDNSAGEEAPAVEETDAPDSSGGGSDPSEGSGSGSSTDGSPGVVEPEPVDETPGEPVEPEVVKIQVVDAIAAMLTIYDTNGDAWLVPGYIMINDQGWFSAVISLVPGVIELPKETDYDIMPLPADDTPVQDK